MLKFVNGIARYNFLLPFKTKCLTVNIIENGGYSYKVFSVGNLTTNSCEIQCEANYNSDDLVDIFAIGY